MKHANDKIKLRNEILEAKNELERVRTVAVQQALDNRFEIVDTRERAELAEQKLAAETAKVSKMIWVVEAAKNFRSAYMRDSLFQKLDALASLEKGNE